MAKRTDGADLVRNDHRRLSRALADRDSQVVLALSRAFAVTVDDVKRIEELIHQAHVTWLEEFVIGKTYQLVDDLEESFRGRLNGGSG